MIFLGTLIPLLAVMLHSIDLSLQFDEPPDGKSVPIIHRDETPNSSVRNPPPRYRSRSPRSKEDPAGFHQARLHPVQYDPAWFSPPEFDFAGFQTGEIPKIKLDHLSVDPSPDTCSPSMPPPSRCIVPLTRLPSNDGHGCGIENLKFIRLMPRTHPSRIFELRKYTFPGDTRLKLRIEGRRQFENMPTQEQIVLSDPYGEVYAILKNHDTLTGLYSLFDKRGKMNMHTGDVTLLTPGEIRETPVGPKRKISNYYDVKQVENE